MERSLPRATSVPQTQQTPLDAIRPVTVHDARQVTVRGANYTLTYDTFETALQKVPAGAEVLSYQTGLISFRLPNPNSALPSSSIPAGVTGPGISFSFPTSEYLYGTAGARRSSAHYHRSYRTGYSLGFAGSDELRGGFLSDPAYAADMVPPSSLTFMEGAAAEQSSDLAKADAALAAGRPADAAALYEAHLKQNGDESQGTFVRHGLALIASGRVSEGAVLMVADDRAALASQMLERSIAAGLDPDLGTRLAAMIADAQK
jgi:hypothetical protein